MSDMLSRMLAAAVAEASDQLRIADSADLNDSVSVVASQAGLAAALRRVLWVLDVQDGAAKAFSAEDGVRRIGIPAQRGEAAA